MKKELLTVLLGVCTTMMSAQTLPYQNANLTAAQRADDLLGRLTLEEKVSLMMDTSPAIERLGIPQFQWWNEALHGVGRNGFATVFPITMGMAASWDDALLHKVFTAVSDEARVKAQQAKRSGDIKRYQSLSYWTPNINIFRDPRWGRGQETYGEDPYLTAKMGLAVVRGLQGVGYQGEDLGISKYRKLLACAKHFAVHSGPEWNRLPLISRTCLSVISGKPICLLSRLWFRRARWLRLCAPISVSMVSLVAHRLVMNSRFCAMNGDSMG